MTSYMQDHFGPYTEQDIQDGIQALEGGGVGKAKKLTITSQSGATF